MSEYPLLNAILFACLGIAIFLAAFAILARSTPFRLWDEVVKEKNTALAILLGAISIGMCMIIAAAMH